MSSVFREAWDAIGSPTLFAVFGESVTHYPLGAVSGTTVTACVEEGESSASTSAGREQTRRMKLTVADSVTVTLRDTWEFNSERWQTESFIKSNGLIVVQVMRKELDRRAGEVMR